MHSPTIPITDKQKFKTSCIQRDVPGNSSVNIGFHFHWCFLSTRCSFIIIGAVRNSMGLFKFSWQYSHTNWTSGSGTRPYSDHHSSASAKYSGTHDWPCHKTSGNNKPELVSLWFMQAHWSPCTGSRSLSPSWSCRSGRLVEFFLWWVSSFALSGAWLTWIAAFFALIAASFPRIAPLCSCWLIQDFFAFIVTSSTGSLVQDCSLSLLLFMLLL